MEAAAPRPNPRDNPRARAGRVVVLGGGACGMSAALRLAEANVEVIVLEQLLQPGGLCGTHERSGYRFDFGGHRFITKLPEISELVQGHAGDTLGVRTRSSVVLYRGEQYRYPLELGDVIGKFGWQRGAHAVAGYALERGRHKLHPRPDSSFEEWVVRRFGNPLYGAFFGPYTEKLWGIRPSQISADWAAERISLVSLTDVLLRLVKVRQGGARTYARRYLYPKLGMGQIFERFAARIASLGGQVRLGAKVDGLNVNGGPSPRLHGVRFTDAAGSHELPCDHVISTISLPTLAGLCASGPLPESLRASATKLRFRGIRLLNILLHGPHVSPHTWMYVSEAEFLPSRIQEPTHRSPEMAPPGCTSLMIEVPCTPGDAVWTMPEGDLFDRCLRDLARLGLRGIGERTLDYFSTFVEHGYPIYHLDYRRDRACLQGFVGRIPNLKSCGRQGTFRYIFMDTAMEMGLRAADAVLAETAASTRGVRGPGSAEDRGYDHDLNASVLEASTFLA